MTTASWHVTIDGAPRTKKNHGSVIQRGRRRYHIPAVAWTKWLHTCTIVRGPGWVPIKRGMFADEFLPIAVPVNCRAIFYRDAERGDSVGYYQGLADLLQWHKLILDDVLLVSWDGTRLRKDSRRPRVELVLEEITPLEAELELGPRHDAHASR